MNVLDEALTFDDVLLLPGYSEVLPSGVNLETRLSKRIVLHVPMLSAAMDTVTESKTAITMAQAGGLGVIHKNLSVKEQAFEVEKVKKSEWGMILEPIRIEPKAKIGQALELMRTYKISGVPVTVDEGGKPRLVGILTNRDLRFEEDMSVLVESRMTKLPLVTVPEGTTLDQAKKILKENRVEKLPVVDSKGILRGLITIKDIQKTRAFPHANKDKYGRLIVGAAIGVGQEAETRAGALIEAGVDALFVDSAHGHSRGVLETVSAVKKRFGEKADIIGGNVATGDITKALAAGASSVMIGSLFAGTDEAPGELVLYHGRSYKTYRGMGSLGAMAQAHGSKDRYFQSEEVDVGKLVPEGIEGRVPYRGSLSFNVHQLLGGLRAGMGYCGAPSIPKLQEGAKFVRITNSGLAESHPHDVDITKEAPNYRLEGGR